MKNPGIRILGFVPIKCLVWGLLVWSAAWILSCQSNEADNESVIQFKNPGMAEGFDSLKVYGINEDDGDTVTIYEWKKGETFQGEVKYPPRLRQKFTLFVKGYKNDSLSYESHSKISEGKATIPEVSLKIIAPELEHVNPILISRFKSYVSFKPTWKTRPGILRSGSGADTALKFSPLVTFTWIKANTVLGKDSILILDTISFPDSGRYTLIAENSAGRDTTDFQLIVKHLVPRLDSIPDQYLVEGGRLSIRANILHSDSLIYRWMKDTTLVSKESVLSIPVTFEDIAGSYKLVVKNKTDTMEIASSNVFTLRVVKPPAGWGEVVWDRFIWR